MSEEKKTAQEEVKEDKVEVTEKEEKKVEPADEKKAESTPEKVEPESTSSSKDEGGSTFGKCLGCGCVFLAVAVLAMILAAFLGYLLLKDYVFDEDIGSSGSTESFETFLDEVGMDTSDVSYDDMCFTCPPLVYEGEVEKTVVISEEDAASWFQTVNSGLYGMKGTRMALTEDGVAIQTTISYSGQDIPVYVLGDIEKVGEKEVDVMLSTVKVASFTIPQQYIDMAEDLLETIANEKIQETDGFRIYKLEINDGEAVFEGTVPERVAYE